MVDCARPTKIEGSAVPTRNLERGQGRHEEMVERALSRSRATERAASSDVCNMPSAAIMARSGSTGIRSLG